MIKNLIYDFGKVLVDYDFETFFRTLIPDAERLKEFSALLNNNEMVQLFDREEQPFEAIVEDIIRQNPKFEYELHTFFQRYTEIVTGEVDGMRELLTRLKAEGYKLYGLTNWCSKVYLTIRQYEIFSLLDGYVISSEEKVVKPEPEIYQRLFSKFGLKPDECLFTDDRPENIEGGRRLGMAGIVFHDARQYEKELRAVLAASNLNGQNTDAMPKLNTPDTENAPKLNEHNKEEYAPAHTAEHLLNQTMIRMFGCERSKNAHIERKKSKINYSLPTPPSAEQIAEIERRMNQLIADDLPVTYEFVSRDNIPEGVVLDKLPGYDERTNSDNASETLRIVRIGDYDICPCIGKHVGSTREIGTFKITSTSYKATEEREPHDDDGSSTNNEARQPMGSFRIVYKVTQ